jgi:hypothetical protein
MVVLGTTIHEFAGVMRARAKKLVDGRTKSDHDEGESRRSGLLDGIAHQLRHPLAGHPGQPRKRRDPGSMDQPHERRWNGSRLKAGMTFGVVVAVVRTLAPPANVSRETRKT